VRRIRGQSVLMLKDLRSGIETPVYVRHDLKPGAVIAGPALLLDSHSTSVIEAGWRVIRFTWHDVSERRDYVVATVRRMLGCAG
jgi:N-methylhydantoinase A/oxoprolinase/acetone carboxylase beta subunit